MKEPIASPVAFSGRAMLVPASRTTFLRAFVICVLGGTFPAAPGGAQTITFSNVILDHPSPLAFDFFADAVAGAGDLNGDGVPDVLVGAPGHDVGGNFAQGQAYVLSEVDASLLLTLDHPNPQAYAFFGLPLAAVGDINKDGVLDLLVAASGQDVGGTINQGQAYLFSGADGSLLLTPDDPNAQGQFFGDALAGVGDVNSDGVPDLLVSAQAQDAGGNDAQGRAFVFSGADGSSLRTLDHPNPQPHARFGFALAAVGDVDGDGVSEYMVAAPFQTVSSNWDQGEAFVFGGADGKLLHALNHPDPQAGGRFGEELAGVGDIDGDGIPDLLVAAPDQDVGGNPNQGQAYLFSGADGSLLRTLDDPSPQAGATFGQALATVGDVNGDGLADLVVGAPRKDVGGNFNEGQAVLFVSVRNIGGQVSISPGSTTPTINVNGKGVITVAVLSSNTLDATTIDISMVKFGPASAGEAHNRSHLEDLNGDGLLDAILHFRTDETGLMAGDTEACIRFMTTGGQSFFGCATIQTIP